MDGKHTSVGSGSDGDDKDFVGEGDGRSDIEKHMEIVDLLKVAPTHRSEASA